MLLVTLIFICGLGSLLVLFWAMAWYVQFVFGEKPRVSVAQGQRPLTQAEAEEFSNAVVALWRARGGTVIPFKPLEWVPVWPVRLREMEETIFWLGPLRQAGSDALLGTPASALALWLALIGIFLAFRS